MEPRNRLRGINFASLCSLAGRYDKLGFRTAPPYWESIPGLLKRFTNSGSETSSLYSRSCVVKSSIGHIPSIGHSQRDVFIIYNIFIIFYGPSEKLKALYSVSFILVSIVKFFICFTRCVVRTGYCTQSLSAADLGYGHCLHLSLSEKSSVDHTCIWDKLFMALASVEGECLL